ncbi:aromatic amino acid ammonia-lyase [Wukongibacter baidiensis]|uniref:aromatic amino acid lyase n=1 Tax=Wukongibacter baidiensis TaxID=1723361 RepID=UPI003D7F2F1D
MKKYYIDGYNLTIEDIILATKGELGTVFMSEEAIERCKNSRNQIDKWMEKDAPVVYGVNTGLGNLKDTALSPEEHLKWNKTIPYPHAVGMGEPIDGDITRAALLIRANLLCRGYSAVRPALIQRMLDIFNAGISPVILELGSTGLSDLGPLAQSAMIVAGLEEAEVFYKDRRDKAQTIFAEVGLEPVFELECKEVLAQMNGSTMTQSLAVFTYSMLEKLVRIHEEIEANIDPNKDDSCYSREKVSIAINNSLKFVSNIINLENNISCDNPLLFETEKGNYEPVMGCNCSNTQVGYGLDLLNILIADMSNIIYENISLAECDNPSVMGLKNMSLSILTKLRTLCMPASADSIPTKGNQEDHVEFSYGAARKAMKAVNLFKTLISYELCSVFLKDSYDVDQITSKMLSQIKNKIGVFNKNSTMTEMIKETEKYISNSII